MTIRAIAGLVVYNLFLLGVGAGVLWGIRGWRWWTELVRLAGVAYFLGVASLMTLLTLELVLGIPISGATILLSGLALAVGGALVGRFRGHTRPRIRPPGWSVPGLTLFSALFVAGIVVYLEALVRADRLSGGTREWDGWAFWLPKAKSIYFFEKLEPDFLASLPQLASYPPGLAFVQAGAFHAMGTADTVSLHVQYWFLAVGFVAAVVGLLGNPVRHAILFPLLLAFLVSQNLVDRITTVYADVPLGYLVALAALLLVLWIREDKTWQLVAAGTLLAGAILTKREGLLFAACVLGAAFVATYAERRKLWRPLVGVGVALVAVVAPWRIWFTVNGLDSDGPDSGYLGAFTHLERVWASLDLALSTFMSEDLWRIAPLLAVAAVVLAAAARAWRTAIFAGSFLVLALAGATWATWAYTALPITRDESQNPIVRITGTTILVLAVLTPVLLDVAWAYRRSEERPGRNFALPLRDALLWKSPWLWTVVALGVLSHPGAMLAGYSGSGLPGGAPRFLAPTDCVAEPRPDQTIRVVVGYADSFPKANDMHRRAMAAGLESEIAKDGCGRLRIFVDDVPSPAAAATITDRARSAALEPTLELDPDD